MGGPRVFRADNQHGLEPLGEAMALCREHLGFAMLFSALVNIAYLAPTLYMLQVYDRVLPSGGKPTLVFLTLALVLTLYFLTFLDGVRTRLLASASVRLDQTFSARIFSKVLLSPAGSGAQLNQLIRDFDMIRQAATGPAATAVFDAPWIPIYIIVCFIVHPLIGALALGGSVVLLVLAVFNERATRGLAKEAAGAANASFTAQDSAGAAPEVVRALGMSDAFVARFEALRGRAIQPQMRSTRTTARIGGLIRFIRLVLQSVALGAGAWLAIDKQVSPGAVFASSMLAARAMAPIDLIVAHWRTMSAAATAYDSVREYLRAPAPETRTALPAPASRLEVQRLCVATPDRERLLLNGISLEVRGGCVVGVIGPSGAGKSTLLQAIANARGADQGEIRLDGARYADWPSQRLARMIGYLPQDFPLFPGTIKENLSRFDGWTGDSGGQIDEKAIAAAQAVGVHELILSLPAGYDTMLGPRGRGLSAGQQQRIGLARALYGDPVVLVLDEPNSAADAEAEAALARTLAHWKGRGRIAVVASHSLSMIGVFDALMVLRRGEVERAGPRDEVLEAIAPQAGRATVAAGARAS